MALALQLRLAVPDRQSPYIRGHLTVEGAMQGRAGAEPAVGVSRRVPPEALYIKEPPAVVPRHSSLPLYAPHFH